MNLEKRIEQNQVESRILNMVKAQEDWNLRMLGDNWQERGTPWMSLAWLEASYILQEHALLSSGSEGMGNYHGTHGTLSNIWAIAANWSIENQTVSELVDAMVRVITEDSHITNGRGWKEDVRDWVERFVSSATHHRVSQPPFRPRFDATAFYQLMKCFDMTLGDLERIHYSCSPRHT